MPSFSYPFNSLLPCPHSVTELISKILKRLLIENPQRETWPSNCDRQCLNKGEPFIMIQALQALRDFFGINIIFHDVEEITANKTGMEIYNNYLIRSLETLHYLNRSKYLIYRHNHTTHTTHNCCLGFLFPFGSL